MQAIGLRFENDRYYGAYAISYADRGTLVERTRSAPVGDHRSRAPVLNTACSLSAIALASIGLTASYCNAETTTRIVA